MKKTLLAAAVLSSLTCGTALAQQQQEGNWLVRVRAVNLDSSNGGVAGAKGVSINNRVIPELDISYFFTPNLAAELVLTYPQKHDVRLNGLKVGTLKHLPPTLMAQYHFTSFGAFKPYVGLGLNYTRFSSVNIADGAVTVKKNSVGAAVQVGADFALNKNWSLNLDVKKVLIDTEVSGGMGKFKVDPVLVGLGVGYRF